jgi:hypothetical protein
MTNGMHRPPFGGGSLYNGELGNVRIEKEMLLDQISFFRCEVPRDLAAIRNFLRHLISPGSKQLEQGPMISPQGPMNGRFSDCVIQL